MTAITIPTSHSTYGRVVCRIIRRVGDGDDAGTEPDALPMSGTITFTPLTKWDRTTDYSALAANEAITGQLNPLTGEMMSPGQPPTIGVDLLVGVYSVSFALDHGTFASFNVEVKATHTSAAPLDLAHEAPYSPPPGVQHTMLVPSGITDGHLLSVSGGALVGVDPATLGGGTGSAPDATTTTKGLVQLAGDLGGTATAPTVVAASTTVAGKVELATTAEATTGTDTTRAVTPAGVKAVGDTKAPASGQADVNALTAGATVTIPATHSMHTLTMTGNTTLAFANPTAGHAFTLKLSGAFTPTFPASVTWAGGMAPAYASGKVYVFATFDAGTSWIGSAL